MALIKTIRYNTRLIFWTLLITVVAFVGLIFLQWGMDILGKGSRRQDPRKINIVGKVAGEEISLDYYLQQKRTMLDQYTKNGEMPQTEGIEEMIGNQVWDFLVKNILLEKECQKNGIIISDKLLYQEIKDNPPDQIKALFANEKGEFDADKYQRELSNPRYPQFWLMVENNMKKFDIPKSAIETMLLSAVRPTDLELWKEYVKRNEHAKVKYVILSAKDVPSDQIQYTQQEVKDYYNKNQETFKNPQQVKIKYFTIKKTPQLEDIKEAEETSKHVFNELNNGADFAEVAKENSDDQNTAASGGKIGWIGKLFYQDVFDTEIAPLAAGTWSKPFQTASGWEIVKINEKKTNEKGEIEVDASRILIEIKPSEKALGDIYGKISEVLEKINAGESLENSIQDYPEIKVAETNFFNLSEPPVPFIPGIGNLPKGAKWIAKTDIGQVSKIFENQDGYYILKLLEKKEPFILSFEDVEKKAQNLLVEEKKMDIVKEKAVKFSESLKMTNNLEISATDMGYEVKPSDNFLRRDFIPLIGMETSFHSYAFSIKPGEIAGPIELPEKNCIAFLQLIEKSVVTKTDFEKTKESLNLELMNMQREMCFSRWFQYIMDNTEIEDNRESLDV